MSIYAWICNLEVHKEFDTGLPQCDVQDILSILFKAKTSLEQPRSAFYPSKYPCKSGFGFFFSSPFLLYIYSLLAFLLVNSSERVSLPSMMADISLIFTYKILFFIGYSTSEFQTQAV